VQKLLQDRRIKILSSFTPWSLGIICADTVELRNWHCRLLEGLEFGHTFVIFLVTNAKIINSLRSNYYLEQQIACRHWGTFKFKFMYLWVYFNLLLCLYYWEFQRDQNLQQSRQLSTFICFPYLQQGNLFSIWCLLMWNNFIICNKTANHCVLGHICFAPNTYKDRLLSLPRNVSPRQKSHAHS
jgi:hypothetical protein